MSIVSRLGGLSIYDFAWVFPSQGLEGLLQDRAQVTILTLTL